MGTDENNIQRTLGRHETMIENVEKTVESVEHKLDALQGSVNAILIQLAAQDGGKKTLMWIVSGVSGLVGALIVALIPLIFSK